MHQDGLAGFQFGVVKQHVLNGRESDRSTGGIAKAHTRRHWDHEPRRHVDQVAGEAVDVKAHNACDVFAEIIAALATGFASPARQASISDDVVADREIGYIRTDGLDFAGGLGANDERQLSLGERHAAPAPDVDVIKADRLNADLYLAGCRRGRRCNVAKLELAIPDQHERPHRPPGG